MKNRKYLHNYKIIKTDGETLYLFADDHSYDKKFFHFYVSPNLEKFKENQILIYSIARFVVEEFMMFSDVYPGQLSKGIDGYWLNGKLIILSEEEEK